MTASAIRIDRCVCEDKPFARLVEIAERERLDLRGLAEREGCGTHCGLCIAYLRRALVTGETVFGEVLKREGL